MIFSKHGYGAFDTPEDSRDFQREHFFGAKEDRKVLKEFDHSEVFVTKDQGQSMACGYFSGIRLVEIKFYLKTGKKLKISNEEILKLWEVGTSLGFGDKKRGSYIYDILKFLKNHPQKFETEDGKFVFINVADYFTVDRNDDAAFWEEVYYGGGVLTGTSSRLGLVLSKAKYRPYIPESKKANKNDGHAFPITGKGHKWKEFIGRKWQYFTDLFAAIHPNSWGKKWGDDGKFYTKEKQRSNLFRFWGFTIEYIYEDIKIEDKSEPVEKVFDDVSNGSWAFEAIKWAKDQGIFKGYDDGTFRPNNPVTRAEMAVVLKRIAEKTK